MRHEIPHLRPLTFLLCAVLLLGAAQAATAQFGGDKRKKKADKLAVQNYVPSGTWEAYFKDDKGRTKKLILPPEVNSDKDWLNLTFTGFIGPTTRLAVMNVENKTPLSSYSYASNSHESQWEHSTSTVPIGGIEEMITTSLYNSHRFDLVERKAVGNVLEEQDFGASGRVTQQSAAKIGKVLGAQYLIFAAVNEWTPEKKKVGGGGGGLIGGGLGGVAGSKSTAEVAMSFRIVDSDTSQVLFAATKRATAGSWAIGGGGIGGGLLGGAGVAKKSPINYALAACVNKGVYDLVMWLKERPWAGSVIKVSGSQVFVNAGSDKGIDYGMRLTALSKGEELVDPDTGISLGSETTAIGTLEITDVKEKYSIATIRDGCAGLKKGDRLELRE